jgi:glucose-6-phosphate 1-dehydrogenase
MNTNNIVYLQPDNIESIEVFDKDVHFKDTIKEAEPAKYFKIFGLPIFRTKKALERGFSELRLTYKERAEYYQKNPNRFTVEGDENHIVVYRNPMVEIKLKTTPISKRYTFKTFEEAVDFVEQCNLKHLIRFYYESDRT